MKIEWKRLLICAILICVLFSCILLPCQAESTEPTLTPESEGVEVTPEIETLTQDERPHWQVVVEDTILPIVAAVVAGSLGTYLLTLPVLALQRKRMREVKEAVALFTSATGGVLKASEIGMSADGKVKELEERLAARERDRQLSEERFGRLLGIFATVFCANEQMVKSGAAREIKRAVEEYEEGRK